MVTCASIFPLLWRELIVGMEIAGAAIYLIDYNLFSKEAKAHHVPPVGKIWYVLAILPIILIPYGFTNLNLIQSLFLTAPLKLLMLRPAWLRFHYHSTHGMLSLRYRTVLSMAIGFVAIHLLAMIWMQITEARSPDSFTNYTMALYFVVTTVATVGYGDIVPTTNLSRYYAMGLEIIGVASFGLIISQLSRVFLSSDKRTEHAKAQLELLANICKQYEIPNEQRVKSLRFFKYLLSKTTNEDEQKVFAMLPPVLQQELRLSMNIFLISKVQIFKDCSRECLSSAANLLQHNVYGPGDRILAKNEAAEYMYLIGHGSVSIHDNDHKLALLRDGQCFGEMALIKNELRSADATAQMYSDIYSLSKINLDALCQQFPQVRSNIDQLIHQRQDRVLSKSA
jgi:voltage-gated potassium channel